MLPNNYQDNYLHALSSVPLSELVKEEYRIYQIYSLMDRAIPYLEDGLKPGQRRILYTLYKNQNKGLLKVSAATGLVLTLHPHGPASIESTIVNLAQDYTFSNNYPLLDKKGYFGERMETSPAAGRYIECKLSKMTEYLLFDDLNQVTMVPNYDEKVIEPLSLLPKLPLMLLNGAEGIGTGFSSVIPSFHHKDIITSMVAYIEEGKAKKIRPYFHSYNSNPTFETTGRITFDLVITEESEKIYITEIPRNFDSGRIYKHLNKFIESGYLKDFIDSSVDNQIKIELVFKKGGRPPLADVQDKMKCSTSMTPNYTLISERGIKLFDRPEEIIELFTAKRIIVVKRRYELLCADLKDKITQNNEIIKFIREKQYEVATKKANRKEYVEYLISKKFVYAEYLADMPIYRMTKEEVEKRKLMVDEDEKKLITYEKIAKSDKLVRQKLIEELEEVREKMTDWMRVRDQERIKLLKEIDKRDKKSPKKSRREFSSAVSKRELELPLEDDDGAEE